MAIVVFGIFGCNSKEEGGGDWGPLDNDEQVELKVMYWSGQQFHAEYGMLFSSEYPNVEFEVVSRQGIAKDTSRSRKESLNEFIEKEQPDILYLFPGEYEHLAREGKLLELDTPIKMSSYNLEGYNPAILSQLRFEGDGKLYGLSPFFSSDALFYNIDLFIKHNVELPRDSMTWEEVFELSKRFPTGGDEQSRIYGFTLDGFGSPLLQILRIGDAYNLKVLNAEATEVQIGSASWRKIFEILIDAIKSGAFYLPSDEEANKPTRTIEDDYFVMGRSAMTFQYPSQVWSIMRAKNQLKNVQPVNWGIVTAPVDPNNRTQSGSYRYSSVFAINAKSSKLKAAWEFVKYANSAEYAQVSGNSNLNGGLFSRTEQNRPQDGRDLDAFFKLEPKADLRREISDIQANLEWTIAEIIAKELTAVAEDKKTLDEAIRAMQKEGEEALMQAKAEGLAKEDG